MLQQDKEIPVTNEANLNMQVNYLSIRMALWNVRSHT